jgi:hypothetical protein
MNQFSKRALREWYTIPMLEISALLLLLILIDLAANVDAAKNFTIGTVLYDSYFLSGNRHYACCIVASCAS